MSGQALVFGLADPGRAVVAACWRLGEEVGGLLWIEGESTAVQIEFQERGADLELSLKSPEASARMTFAPQLALESSAQQAWLGVVGVSEVAFERNGRERTLTCPAQVSRWSGDPLDGADLLRHVWLSLGEGDQLLCAARRPRGTAEHGEEETAAWRARRDHGAGAFEEALLSTQYDGEGRPTRIGLELWPEAEDELGPTRAAGVVIGGSQTEHTSAVLLDISCEGQKGIGSYLIWRR